MTKKTKNKQVPKYPNLAIKQYEYLCNDWLRLFAVFLKGYK